MKTAAALFSLSLAMCWVAAAAAVTTYEIVPLGLDGVEHTSNFGFRDDTAKSLNNAGQVIGTSNRYIGTNGDFGRSAWLYDGTTNLNIGLTGPEHTSPDGTKISFPERLNEAGQVIGRSTRYSGNGNATVGESAWLYDGTSTLNIGLTNAEHTASNGHRFSSANKLNEAGHAIGTANRYNGGASEVGQSAWFYDGTTTVNIGLTGSEHTRSNGYKASGAFDLNQAGQVLGYSNRYNGGNTELGRSVWLYNGTDTKNIGLTGPQHTRVDGLQYSYSVALNEAGQVNGFAARFSGSTDKGSTAWLYNGTTTIDIGLTGPEHTRNDGFKASSSFNNSIHNMNEAGQVIGTSNRYLGTPGLRGSSAWLYDGTATINIGLIDSEHTQIGSGDRVSGPDRLNEMGQVIGRSFRYSGTGNPLGTSAWLYDGATTIEIGLMDSQNTRIDGYRENYAEKINEAGDVGGFSFRYNGGFGESGYSAWLYDGATTRNIGFTSPAYTRNDGFQLSGISELNEAGQVSGVSFRYNGENLQMGQDAWLYDPVLQQTFSMQLSSRSDGYAYSSINYLGDDGLALGTYQLFDALDNFVDNRAFYFTVADGLHELGALVDGGLAANGWQTLADALRGNSHGQILGLGRLASLTDGQVAYLLTPVPEPSTLFLAALGAIGLLFRRRF